MTRPRASGRWLVRPLSAASCTASGTTRSTLRCLFLYLLSIIKLLTPRQYFRPHFAPTEAIWIMGKCYFAGMSVRPAFRRSSSVGGGGENDGIISAAGNDATRAARTHSLPPHPAIPPASPATRYSDEPADDDTGDLDSAFLVRFLSFVCLAFLSLLMFSRRAKTTRRTSGSRTGMRTRRTCARRCGTCTRGCGLRTGRALRRFWAARTRAMSAGAACCAAARCSPRTCSLCLSTGGPGASPA